jgi:DNA invertase Pin-like site-specific DNA recombinase
MWRPKRTAACWLGRSLANLIETLGELEAVRVDLFLHRQAIDTTTPAGRLFFHTVGGSRSSSAA